MELVYPPVIALARTVFALQGLKFTITGAENVPRTGGAVMAINHVGYLDFTFAGLAALPRRRLVRFMAKQEVFQHPVSGPLMRGMHHIPVDRDAGASSFRDALKALKDGEIVGVFPEGTISRSFELQEFKPGAVRLAQAARVPILPTIVWGSQRVWTKALPKRMGRTRTPISISVGEPIEAPRGPADELNAALRARMAEMLAEVQAAYGDQPKSPEDAWWLPVRLGGTAPTLEEAKRLEVERLAAERLRKERRRADRPA